MNRRNYRSCLAQTLRSFATFRSGSLAAKALSLPQSVALLAMAATVSITGRSASAQLPRRIAAGVMAGSGALRRGRRPLGLGALLIGLALATLVLMPGTSDAQANNAATGKPRILLTEEGRFLFADVLSIDDDDGLPWSGGGGFQYTSFNYDYQWIRIDGQTGSETNIGSNSNRYRLGAADGGHLFKVVVSFTDDESNAESVTSLPFGPVLEPVGPSRPPRPLVANTGQSPSAATMISSDYYLGFRLGKHGQGYEIDSVSIDLAAAPQSLTVSLWIGGIDGVPNSDRDHKLFDFVNPDSLQAGLNTFTAPGGAVAYQNVNYWIALSGFGGSLSITETTSDDQDPGGEPGAIIYNDATSSGSGVLRMAVEGSRRDRGILVANLTIPYGGDQEIISIGDRVYYTLSTGPADRYLVRGFTQIQDDTTGVRGGMADPFDLHAGTETGTRLFRLVNTRNTAGLNEWMAPQGATVGGGGTFTFVHKLEVFGDRLFSVLTRTFPPAGAGEDEDVHAGFDEPTAPNTGMGTGTNTDVALPAGHTPYMAIFGEPLHAMVQNFGQTDAGYRSVTSTNKFATNAFTTGPNALGYRFRGVDVNVEGSDSKVPDGRTSVKVSIYTADSNADPDQHVFDLINPDEYKAGHTFFEAPPRAMLDPDTEYVLVWEHLGGTDHRLRRTTADAEDSGKLPGFSIRNTLKAGTALNSLDWSSGGHSLEIAIYGEALEITLAPSLVPGQPHVSAGGYHSCALDAGGNVGCVGRNDEGQLNVPTLDSGKSWTMVSAGEFHTCGLIDDGTVQCWGDDGFGQAPSSPVSATSGSFVSVDAGPWHTCASTDEADFECWGRNDDGQLVDGEKPERGKKPEEDFGRVDWIDQPSGATVVMVSAGGSVLADDREANTSHSYTCVLWSNGEVGCAGMTGPQWDRAWHGIKSDGGAGESPKYRCNLQTDNGILEQTDDERCAPGDPMKFRVLNVPDLDSGLYYSSVSVGGKHACATVNDGSIRCWGREHAGAVGFPQTWNGNVISEKHGTRTPMAYGMPEPPAGYSWRSVSCGQYHTCAVAETPGGGVAGSGDSEQPDDGLDHTVFEGFDLHADEQTGTGMWSDGETLFTLDPDEKQVFAYHLRNDPATEANEYGTHDTSKGFSLINDEAFNLTGDGTLLWITERQPPTDVVFCLPDTLTACTYGYSLGPSVELTKTFKHYDNTVSPAIGVFASMGNASDGRRLFIGNTGRTVLVYSIWDNPDTDEDEFGKFLDTISFSTGLKIRGMYTDGEVLWVGGSDSNTVEARRISDGARMTDLEFSFPSTVTSIHGLWFNGVTFFGLQKSLDTGTSKVYTYRFRSRATPHGMVGATGPGGGARIGDLLRADTSTITDDDGLPQPFAPDYQWQRDDGGGWSDISGETSVTYRVGQADDGSRLRVVASFTDGAGFDEVLNGPWTRVGAPTDRVVCWGNEIFLKRDNPNYPASRSNPASSPSRDDARLPSVGSWHSCWIYGADGDERVTCMGDQDFRQSTWVNRTVSAPETLVSNLDETRFGSGIILNPENAGAVSFETGSSQAPFDLTSVEVDPYADMTDTSGLEFSVWSSHISSRDLAPRPNAKVCTLSTPPSLTAGTVDSFVAPGGCRLAGSATYWLVFESPDNSFSVAVTSSDSEDGESRSGWSIGDEMVYRPLTSSGAWSGTPTTTPNPMRISLKGHFQGFENSSQEQNVDNCPTCATVGAPKPKLVAEFQDDPLMHDGSSAFTMTLALSDEVTISADDLKDHGLKVTGGSITSARRVADSESERFEITVQPSSNDAVTVSMVITPDCDAQGAICTSDGRMLTAYLLVLVLGPPAAPDTGLPTISGPTVLDQTLTADVSGINDPDGLTTASFTYQWVRMADDSQGDIAGATSATYTLTQDDVGNRLRVRVRYTDDAGNNHSLTSAATEPVTKPKLGTVELVDGTDTTAVAEVALRGSHGVAVPVFVGYKPAHSEEDWTVVEGKTDPSTGKATVTLSDLTEGTSYQLRASLTSDLDPFLFTTFTAGRTARAAEGNWADGPPGQPGKPTIERGDHQLTVTWTPPEDNGTAAVKMYRIELRREGQSYDQSSDSYTVSAPTLTRTITNLANGVTYYLRVSAANSDEIKDGRRVYGPASEEASGVPGTGAVGLGTPVLAEPEYLHHRMVRLDWQDIEGADWYEVQYHHPHSNKWVELPHGDMSIANHGSSATLNGLHEGFLWFVRVRALGCGGPSEWSEIMQIGSTSASDWTDVDVPEVVEGDTRPESSGQCPPGTPVLEEPTHPRHRAVALDWQDIEGAPSYQVQYDHPHTNEWVDLPHGDMTIAYDGSSAVLDGLHEGHLWFVRVRAIGPGGTSGWSEILMMASTSASDFGNRPATGAPAISGTAQVGQTLTASTSGISDADGLDDVSYTYQWVRNDGTVDSDIQDATNSTYELVDADAGKTIKVKVSFEDDDGNQESLTSAATPTVSASSNNLATGAPGITGTVQAGQTLTASTSAITDDDGLDNVSYSYQWIRNDGATDSDIPDATGSTYELTDDDVGKTIKVRVSFTDDQSNPESLTSAATATVAARPNTAATGAPSINGTAQAGQTLTASTSDIVDADGLDDVSYTYQWIRNDGTTDSDIPDATGATYELTDDDVGKTIKVKVTFTDDRNNSESLTSTATSAVTARPNSSATGAPTITGTAQVSQTLTVSTSGIVDTDGLDDVSYGYQWIRNDGTNDSDIAGAIGSTYELVDADQGKAIKVRVSFEDDRGNSESLTSAATTTVAARPNRPAAGLPAISGTANVGDFLTADLSNITDADGLDDANYSYQWIVNTVTDGSAGNPYTVDVTDDGTTWTPGEGTTDIEIGGTNGNTFTVSNAVAGRPIRLRVSFTDDAGNKEVLLSAPTLVANTVNVPASHDGSTAFTFELRFSENVQLSFRDLRDDGFQVTGGEVTRAKRLDKPSNVRWEIHVQPSGNGSVSITLPNAINCSAQGAVCTADGRKLSNRTAFTVNGQ